MTRLTAALEERIARELKSADDPKSHLVASLRAIATLYEADAFGALELSSRLSFLAAVALTTPAPFATCEVDGTEVYITMRKDGKFVAKCSASPQHIQVLNL